MAAVIGIIIIGNKLEDLCSTIEDVHSVMALDVKTLFQVIKLGDALLDKRLTLTCQNGLVNHG